MMAKNKTTPTYSVVIPTYGRSKYLNECFSAVATQIYAPNAVHVIDNNITDSESKYVLDLVKSFDDSFENISFTYTRGIINSGAVARNIGARKCTSDYVGFLDDDVIVDSKYYLKLMQIINDGAEIVGIQGIDRSLVENYEQKKNQKYNKFIKYVENFFENGTIITPRSANLRPSLSVCHPQPDSDFTVESQWISTCAGMFKRDIFDKVSFPDQFIKYSWNEYVYFSYMIYKKNLGKMVYTSKAHYRNIIGDIGRMPQEDLIYMAEVYDLFIFSQLFDRNLRERLIFVKSRIGRFLFQIARAIKRRHNIVLTIRNLIGAYIFCLKYRGKILRGDLSDFTERFYLSNSQNESVKKK